MSIANLANRILSSGQWCLRAFLVVTGLALVTSACGVGGSEVQGLGGDKEDCPPYVSPRDTYGYFAAGTNWWVVEDAQLLTDDAPGVPKDLAEAARQRSDPSGRGPYVVVNIQGRALSGVMVEQATVSAVLGEPMQAALERGAEVWISVRQNEGGESRIQDVAFFDHDGRVTFAWDCSGHIAGGVHAAHESIKEEFADSEVIVPPTERDLLAEVIRAPDGQLARTWRSRTDATDTVT